MSTSTSTMLDLVRAASPAGDLLAVVKDGRLCALAFADSWPALERILRRRFGAFETREVPESAGVARALAAYARGDLGSVDTLKLDSGGTPFQERVWTELRRVPAGKTVSYSELAARVGDPKAVRAVAMANARNPIALVVPCHRVIAKDGSLWGYAGGLDRKATLLRHEGADFGRKGHAAHAEQAALPLETR